MKAIPYTELDGITYPELTVEEYSKKSLKRFIHVFEKLNSIVLISMTLALSSRRAKQVEKEHNPQEAYTETGNIVLDMYCQEGMRLFNQGEYAANIKVRSAEEEL
ncbi:MAG: hypothetical protein CFE21_08920 [Bacteroidetes bacterium B1(2017)]|nr:MAG: hypothetical protein CFE21_08920 [Bacteroidetes bacterium B1(2017)]